ncbi:MAG: DUF5009 domain-containing protein [Bacteroidetes bacterium]|nr:DUF5009 domain-containing protein [Bacteroidota bacterium]
MIMQQSQRLYSIDALRGFDMFWIIGGEYVIHSLKACTGWTWTIWLSSQLEHVEWNGFHFYDLIFPLFLFLSGMTMPFSLSRQLENGIPKSRIYLKVFRRALLLVLFGIIYNGLYDLHFSQIRFASVLGHIGIAYFFAAIIYLNTNVKRQIIWIIGLLLGYWAILKLVPVPDVGAGVLTIDGCINGYVDRLLLPGKFYEGIFDPEGILVKIPAVATALLGAVTGSFVKMTRIKGLHKTGYLLLAFIFLFMLARLWDLWLPINKKLWTSSFVLYAAAWSVLFFTVFYLIIDVLEFRKWAFPFVVIGLNPITIYMATSLIDFSIPANHIFGGLMAFVSQNWQPVFMGLMVILIEWLLLYFLYKKKIFLKV